MATIYTMGELLVEIMRDRVDVPLDRPGTFLGPYPSGAPAIFISTVAQLGHQGKIWGGVAEDRFGNLLLEKLTGDGVDCSSVQVVPEASTAVAFIAYDGSGEREFIYHIDSTPAVDIRFSESEQESPDYFHVMGCSLMINDTVLSDINRAAQWAKEGGAKVSFDPNIRPELLHGRDIWEVAGSVMNDTNIFLPGVDELRLFTGITDITESVTYMFDRCPNLEIIHLKKGKRGSEIFTRVEHIPIGLYPIEKVLPIIDPTGAGDSFDAAFLCGLAEGMILEEAGNYAAKAAAINSTAMGPIGGDLRQIHHDFLSDNV